MSKYIPGQPQFLVQFVPDGGNLRLENQFASGGMPNDGTIIGLSSNGMPTTPLLSADVAKFDPTKFYFLGNPMQEVEILAV